MRVNITIDKEQKTAQQIVDAFQRELDRRIKFFFPLTRVSVKKGSMTGVEIMGFDSESDRERLDGILQEVWEDESWR
ncbi:DinI-like family protein [Enterobacter hormaechei]|uniref:DinI-like family protein n=1 Tax=Enterobacter cloacae complex TaxID=354276 RepID=UPI00066943A3|nr:MULTISPECIES: DinI-like family protein [Enterobacter cloacae complex]HDR2890033.1 DinI-like family protein [Enterobacter asburiae]HEE9788083.1 DinI-like family protein [Enterobacter soli]KZQ86537.1 DNA damage-inducible protein [Enterobacter hormaechei subsp. steigerwaltii]MDL5463453.1 DinI-like family protein [Enterobacter hormaechei]ULQ21581.1 DinI-like family protein [Enterobacter hormaechei subsp. xiangfangensis]